MQKAQVFLREDQKRRLKEIAARSPEGALANATDEDLYSSPTVCHK